MYGNLFNTILRQTFGFKFSFSVLWNLPYGCNFVLQPERIKPDEDSPGYDVKSDVWSLGITLVTTTFLLTLQKLHVLVETIRKFSENISVQYTCSLMSELTIEIVIPPLC